MALSIVSCSPKLYTANTQNVPLITKKGQTNLSLIGNGSQIEFQGAYGLGEHIAVQANGGLFIPSDLDNGNGGSGKFVELGAGYYKPIHTNWVFETYYLAGIGSMENHLPSTKDSYPLTNGNISANIFRTGIQPNFGYVSKHFSAAISSRFVSLTYSKIDGELIYENQIYKDYLNDNKYNFLMEPAITIKAGLEKIKFQMQYGYSFNLTNSNFRQQNSYLTFGLNLNLNLKD